LYAWASIPVTAAALDADVMRTLTLKAINLIVQLDCPDFSDSLWINMLLYWYIELNCIYASHYALEVDT